MTAAGNTNLAGSFAGQRPRPEPGGDAGQGLAEPVDSGFEIPPAVIERAIRDVREHYHAARAARVKPRKKSSGSTPVDSPTTRAAASRRWPWRRPAWFACRNSPNTTTGGFRRTLRSLNRRCVICPKGTATTRPSACLLRLHHLLRCPGLVSGRRRAMEAELSAAPRPPGFQPDSRGTIRRTTADGEIPATSSAARRECFTRRPSPVLCWRYRIVICRSSRKARSIACGNNSRRSECCPSSGRLYVKSARRDSNPQPSVPKTDALSIELRRK